MSRTRVADRFDFKQHVAYDPEAKCLFHKETSRQLLALAQALGVALGDFDLRSNVGGIAPGLRACEGIWFAPGSRQSGIGSIAAIAGMVGSLTVWGLAMIPLCGGYPEPVGDPEVIGQGVPQRDRLGLEQAPHRQAAKTTVLVRGVEALDQFAPAKVTFPRKSGHRITRISPLPALG